MSWQCRDYWVCLCWVDALFLPFCFISEFSVCNGKVFCFTWLLEWPFHRECLLVLEAGGRGGQRELVYCITKGSPKDWVWKNRENGEGLPGAYLIFWILCPADVQGVSSQVGVWDTETRQEAEARADGLWQCTEGVKKGKGRLHLVSCCSSRGNPELCFSIAVILNSYSSRLLTQE